MASDLLTILIPALNEEKTIEIVIKKAQKWLNDRNIDGEILIANNGSTDNTKEIALKNGARVIDIEQKGYGSALISGIENSKGKYIIFGDADDSYNFLEIDGMYDKLKDGNDIVIGNRYAGKMEKGSMKFSHKFIGTPILSFLIRKKFKLNLNDINCGLRGIKKDAIIKLNCKSSGMEFASEMLIKAAKAKLKIEEIPINFYKDKRNSKPHLKTLQDGVRHLKIILKE
mgnify:CR=1 FL=1